MTRDECLNCLELDSNATNDDVVHAFRELAKLWHPDCFPNNAELQTKAQAKFARINEAYHALRDEKFKDDKEDDKRFHGIKRPSSRSNRPYDRGDHRVDSSAHEKGMSGGEFEISLSKNSVVLVVSCICAFLGGILHVADSEPAPFFGDVVVLSDIVKFFQAAWYFFWIGVFISFLLMICFTDIENQG